MGRGAGKGGRDATPWMAGDKQRFQGFNSSSPDRPVSFSLEEVQKHRTPSDAWMIYRNKVYDVSGWHEHPGGNVIFTHAGDDFTDIFAAFHPPTAYAVLEPFYIGDLDEKSAVAKPAAQRAFEKSYRELRSKLLTMGMYNSDPWYYVMVCSRQMALWAASVACVVWSDRWDVNMLGAFLMAVFWQQCGWLAHDFLHHQVFKNRAYGDLAGVFWGNLMQGFSVGWWKNKHNTHHAVPNLHESSADAHDGDPDMDTMPVLAWSIKMAEAAKGTTVSRFLIGHQAFLYFPILLIARVSWVMQSFLFVFNGLPGANLWTTKGADTFVPKSLANKLESPGLIGHLVWMSYLAFNLGFVKSLAFFAVAQCGCGLFLALVFGLGHNGMATYDADARPDFWKLQVTTTRNVTSTPFVDWFCGGLQYQVDHHLFPQIPRHNLRKVHTLVESFCKQHDVHYHEASMWEGTKEVLSHLSDVSAEFIAEFPAM